MPNQMKYSVCQMEVSVVLDPNCKFATFLILPYFLSIKYINFNFLASHRFNRKETDWGFSQFCNHAQLSKPGEGMAKPCLENDQFSLRVFIKRVQDTTGVLWHNFAEYFNRIILKFSSLFFIVGIVN
jgi:hypothetical protein